MSGDPRPPGLRAGICCPLGLHTAPALSPGFAGTPGYLSPEVLRKEAYGKPVDIWACGEPSLEVGWGRGAAVEGALRPCQACPWADSRLLSTRSPPPHPD